MLLAAEIVLTKTVEEEECKIKELHLHHNQVREDREELARLVRLCKIDPTRHVGFMIDVVDSNKFGIPTTEHTPKALAKLWRVKQKLTGVQFFGDDSVVLYRTLPDVPLGGNLTLTIILDMLAKGHFKQATHMYINLDGASDNICYHVYYGLAFFLRCAHLAGWPLHTITLLRLKVGHTHNQLDGTFGVVTRHVYGRQCGGTTAKDVLSFSAFDKASTPYPYS